MTNYSVDSSQRVPIKMWTNGVPVEDQATVQLRNVASLPFIHKHVAVMPDVHWGMGATVGSVIPTKGAIVPAAVGVDIGCGMMAQRTTLTASDLPDSLLALRTEIERRIPHGRTNNGKPGDRGAWHNIPDKVVATLPETMATELLALFDKYPQLRKQWTLERALSHAGTLGTGNHFVEVCLDEEARVWIMLHSGSRGIGNRIGTYFIERAKEDMKRWFINLPDADLAYLPQGSDLFKDYCDAVEWAQQYALYNRKSVV